jgi:hypothetical protein
LPGIGVPLGIIPLGIIPLGIIPLGIIPPGIGAPLGIGIPLGLGMSGIILSGIFMSQHLSPGFGAAGAGGLSGWGAEAVTGCSVKIPEDPAQVPAKKVATAIQAKAKTAAITRLRSRRSLLSSPKNPIVDSSQSGEEALPQPDDIAAGTSAGLLSSYVDRRRELRGQATRAFWRLRNADRLGFGRAPTVGARPAIVVYYVST